jgi:hypothetical protein
MSVCANFQPDRPCCLAVYTGQNRTEQNVTETILEKYNILEPVSVGGWKKIQLRRITRSSTCVCLRICNYFVCSARPTLELPARGSCCALFHPCTLALRARSHALRSRGSAEHTPAPITCAHCCNGFLYQFGGQCGICGTARTFARASMRTRDRRPP